MGVTIKMKKPVLLLIPKVSIPDKEKERQTAFILSQHLAHTDFFFSLLWTQINSLKGKLFQEQASANLFSTKSALIIPQDSNI